MAAEEEDLVALLALLSLDEIGPARLKALLTASAPTEHSGADTKRSPTQALTALKSAQPTQLVELLGCRGVSVERLHKWAKDLCRIDGAALLTRHRSAGVQIDTPSQLAQTQLWGNDPEPPQLLFCRGAAVDYDRTCNASPQQPRVAVVGTRRCSGYGKAVARQLGTELARAGITVVSGVASGIDSIAQRSALDAGGIVMGVVASGLDVIYPPGNAQLWNDIANSATSTLLSEYPLGTDATRWRFPARNRLIAALADAVIVVESPATGGSLYTVDAALERDRPVLAVPGPITAKTSEGTNSLIADGCSILRNLEDVLVALDLSGSLSGQPALAAADPDQSPVTLDSNLNPEESLLLGLLNAQPATLDELLSELQTTGQPNWSYGKVALTLDGLRSSGWIAESGGWWERLR